MGEYISNLGIQQSWNQSMRQTFWTEHLRKMTRATLCIAIWGLDGATILQTAWTFLKSYFPDTNITVIITVEQQPRSELYALTINSEISLVNSRYWHKFTLDDTIRANLKNIAAIENIPGKRVVVKMDPNDC